MMKRRKNGFWTFVFSFIPGCAEMYMGFMKMGISLMAVFFGIAALSQWVGSSILVFVSIVVWFYGFFHARNMAGMDDAQLQQTEDEYLFHIPEEWEGKPLQDRYRKWLAVLLIFFGSVILYKNIIYFISDVLGDAFPYELYRALVYVVGDRVPQIAVAVVIIVIGVKMVAGKKKQLEADEAGYTSAREEETFEDSDQIPAEKKEEEDV